jgi:hypothetical protein
MGDILDHGAAAAMRERSRRLVSCLTATLGLAAAAHGQPIRRVSLDPTGRIDRRFLPADSFDFSIRAASELKEFRGRYGRDSASISLGAPWTRVPGTGSRDATLRVPSLSPGVTYHFEFTLVRRPTGNESRLIEVAAQDALQAAFRTMARSPLDSVVATAAPNLRRALDTNFPGAEPDSASPFTGSPAALLSALRSRGVDLVHADYRSQADRVERLRDEFLAARRALIASAAFLRAVDTIAGRRARVDGFAELEGPVLACRALREPAGARDLALTDDGNQVNLLAALKAYDANWGLCRGRPAPPVRDG